MLNENLEDVPRFQLLNFVDQLRKFVKCEHPNVHIRSKKKTSFLINGLQQPGVVPGIGYASRSSFVDLLEDSKKVISLPKYNLPVSKMGDYQSFLINQKVLRPIEEDASLQKANIFGSPYRLKKMQDRHKLMKNMGSVDEILHLDESAHNSPMLKRKMNEDEFPSQQTGKRRKYDSYDDPHSEQENSFSFHESSPDVHSLLRPDDSHEDHVLYHPRAEKQPLYVTQQQTQIRNYNIRRLFVNNLLRVPVGDNIMKLENNIRGLVEKVSHERDELIHLLIKEALAYKSSKIVQILTDLLK
jgi:hypothetical protein